MEGKASWNSMLSSFLRVAPRALRGLRHDRSINDDMERCVQSAPDKLALDKVKMEGGETMRCTCRELNAMTGIGISPDCIRAGMHVLCMP
jgi:cyclohexanecarboxylate-CoA ligase